MAGCTGAQLAAAGPELLGRALQGRPRTVSLLDGVIDDWLQKKRHS
jgi:hypothetical protein